MFEFFKKHTNELSFDDPSDLRSFLKKGGISLDLWGTGKYKDVDDLLDEIRKKDCILQLNRNQVERITWPVFIDVLYSNQNVSYHLIEEKQRFYDGRERVRTLPASIGEKGHYREDPIIVARRAIDEELYNLAHFLTDSNLRQVRRWEENDTGRSYPGLTTKQQCTKFDLILKPDQGVPDSFVLQESRKFTYFIWRSNDS